MDKIIPAEIENVLVIRIGKIGDIIATSFVFEVLKDNNPSIKIDLITKDSNENILRYNPRLNKVFYLSGGIKRYLQLFLLRKKKYDLIIDFNDNPSKTTKLIYSYFNGRIKCGYDFPLYAPYLNLKVSQPSKENTHIIERMRHFLIEAGFKCKEELVKPFFYSGETEWQEVKNEITNLRGEIISINISSGAKIRNWDSENWIELIKRIYAGNPSRSIIVLSTSEERNKALYIKNECKFDNLAVPKNKSFQHFASYIANSRLLITPDTSAVHAASAFGVPVIALFPHSEWNFASWQPYKTSYRSIHSQSESVNSISVDEVFNNFNELIREIS